MSVTKIGESRERGFLNFTGGNPGFNPVVGLRSHLNAGTTKFFGMFVLIASIVTVGIPAPLDFSSPLSYPSIEMRGNNRGYRGRLFQICEGTLQEADDVQGRYRGILEFNDEEKHEFVSSISELKEEVQYELYAGGLDSRPATGPVVRIVEVQEVSER